MKIRRVIIVLLISFLLLFIASLVKDKSTEEFQLKTIDQTDIANGMTGEFISITSEARISAALVHINESSYVLFENAEETSGWKIGVRIYSEDRHYWFMPDRVNDFKYATPNYFRDLLLILTKDKNIDFVEKYIN